MLFFARGDDKCNSGCNAVQSTRPDLSCLSFDRAFFCSRRFFLLASGGVAIDNATKRGDRADHVAVALLGLRQEQRCLAILRPGPHLVLEAFYSSLEDATPLARPGELGLLPVSEKSLS